MPVNEPTPPLQIKRAVWHTRVQLLVFFWFAAATVVGLWRFDDWVWFLVHFLMLGAVSNALFIWSWHFTGAILRVPDQADRAGEVQRLALLNLGVGGTVIAVRAEAVVMIWGAVAFVLAAVVLHARAMVLASRRALPSPYSFTVHVYIAACALLVPGLLLGAWMELLDDHDPLLERLVLAHVSLNVLGWVGLPILGTIVTLWPTMLRTRIAPKAALLGRQALPLLATGVVVTATAFALGRPLVAVAGLAAYLAGFVRTLGPLLVVARSKRPASFSTWSAAAGLLWLLGAVIVLLTQVATLRTVERIHDALTAVAFVAVIGVLQTLLGCMAYLLPAMAAGGPTAVRWRNDRADRGMVLRFVLVNTGALLCLIPASRYVGGALLLLGVLGTLVTIASTLRTPSAAELEAAEAARIWVDDKEQRRYPLRRR